MDFGSDPPKEQGANMLPVYFSGPCFGDSTPTGPPTSPVPQVGGRLDAVGSDEEVDELQDDTGAQGSPVLMGSSPESYMLTSSQDEVDELEETMSEESVGMAVGEGADNIERAMVLGSSQDEVDELEGSTDEDMGDNLSTNGSTSARPGLLISLDDGTAGDSDLVVGADALSEGLLDIAIEPTRSSSAYTAPISGGDGAYSDLMGISFEASPVEEGSPMSASGNVAHAQEDVEFEVLSSSPVSEGAFQQGGVVHRGAAFGHKADDSAVQSAEDERCASGDEINREQLGFYRGLMELCKGQRRSNRPVDAQQQVYLGNELARGGGDMDDLFAQDDEWRYAITVPTSSSPPQFFSSSPPMPSSQTDYDMGSDDVEEKEGGMKEVSPVLLEQGRVLLTEEEDASGDGVKVPDDLVERGAHANLLLRTNEQHLALQRHMHVADDHSAFGLADTRSPQLGCDDAVHVAQGDPTQLALEAVSHVGHSLPLEYDSGKHDPNRTFSKSGADQASDCAVDDSGEARGAVLPTSSPCSVSDSQPLSALNGNDLHDVLDTRIERREDVSRSVGDMKSSALNCTGFGPFGHEDVDRFSEVEEGRRLEVNLAKQNGVDGVDAGEVMEQEGRRITEFDQGGNEYDGVAQLGNSVPTDVAGHALEDAKFQLSEEFVENFTQGHGEHQDDDKVLPVAGKVQQTQGPREEKVETKEDPLFACRPEEKVLLQGSGNQELGYLHRPSERNDQTALGPVERTSPAGPPVPTAPKPTRSTVAGQLRQHKKLSKPFRCPTIANPPAKPSVPAKTELDSPREREEDKVELKPQQEGRRQDAKMKHRTTRAAGQFRSPLTVMPSGQQALVRPTPTIQALELKAQTLRRALRVVRDKEEEILTNLIAKWKEAGREVAYELWALVRDAPGEGGSAWASEGPPNRKRKLEDGWGWDDGSERKKARSGNGSSWGWDSATENETEHGGNENDAPACHEEEEEEKVHETLGTMLMQLGIFPSTLGWDEEEGCFVD